MSLSASAHATSMRVSSAKSVNTTFRPDVQGLRAFAVLAVIFAHVTGWPTGGFVGVDVFFVISGFLITGLLLREHEKTGGISFRQFYKRRVKRVLPASILVLVTTTLAAVALLPKTRGDTTVMDALWSLFFAGNWRFASSGTDYFNEGVAPSPLQHFWSLAVEEQFYFVWPWLMLGIFWLVAHRGGNQNKGGLAVGVVMIAVSIASFSWAVWETNNNHTVAYFSTFSRTWELGIGAVIAVAAPLLGRIPSGSRTVFAWLGLLGLLVSVLTITPESVFPAPWALLPVLSTALVIGSGTGGEAKHLYPLTNRVSGYVGDISYSLYLWHWPVAILLVAFLESGTPLFYLFAITLTLTLSIASYHFVENPIRYLGSARKTKSVQAKQRKSYSSAGLAVLALTTLIAVGASLMVDRDRSLAAAEAPVMTNLSAATSDAEPCRGAARMDPSSDCNHSVITSSLTPSIDDMAADQGNGYECWIAESEEMRTCAHGSSGTGGLRVALVGDSHAASLIPALTSDIDSTGWSLDTYVGNGCQWRTIAPDNKNCGSAMQQIQKRLTENEPYDVILTTASRAKFGSDYSRALQLTLEAWQPAIDRGTKIVVIEDVPLVDEGALECLTRVGYDPAKTDCSTPEGVALAQADVMVDAAAAVQAPVVELSDLLCVDGKCPAVIGGVIVYKDAAAHLTATYARTMSPYVTQRIQDAIAAS